MTKILAISDIIWNKSEILLNLIYNVKPDLLIMSGDIFERQVPVDNIESFWDKLEEHNIMTLAVKGNHDYYSQYDKIFTSRGYRFIKDISNQYFHYNGLTFLGLPYQSFTSLENVRSVGKKYSEKVDVLVAHPSTARRIFAFDVNPRIALFGHDDLRICNVLNSLLITTNRSPDNYAVLEVSKNQVKIFYYQYRSTGYMGLYSPWLPKEESMLFLNKKLPEGYLSYSAKWYFKDSILTWLSEEHYCYHPPHIFPERDKDYGNLLGTVIYLKRTKTKSQILKMFPKLIKMRIPKTILSEYLNISRRELSRYL